MKRIFVLLAMAFFAMGLAFESSAAETVAIPSEIASKSVELADASASVRRPRAVRHIRVIIITDKGVIVVDIYDIYYKFQ